MLTEPLPIHIFIHTRYSAKAVLAIIENWGIDGTRLQGILTSHFREMGIHAVHPSAEKEIMQFLLFLLRHSPEIQNLVRQAAKASASRRHSRHAS